MTDDKTILVGGSATVMGSQPTVLGGSQTMMGSSPTIMGGSATTMGARTVMGGDPGRTVMGSPSETLTVEAIPGNRYSHWLGSPRNHLLVTMKSGGTQPGRRAPLNVCLAIDRSGSMEGEPLEYVKRACEHVVDMLEPNDILSIVVFEENVDVLMPARKVVNKPLVKEHIRRLYVGNTTNIYDGIMSACLQITTVMSQAQGYVHRVLLLTDGEPTSGLRDYNSIVTQVADQKKRGISITALGFGAEYNEELMSGIAKRSGGNYYHIQRPDLIPEVFRIELNQMMGIVAKNVRVRVTPAKWVNFRMGYGLQPSTVGKTIEVAIPDVERGALRTALFEFDYEKHPQGAFRTALVEVVYDDLVNNRTATAGAASVVEFTQDRNIIQSNYHPVVQTELEIAQASLNLQRTMMSMRTQQMTAMGAVTELEKTRTMLLEAGRTGQAQEITMALETIKGGDASVEKTLMGTIYNLDQGKRQ